MNGTDRTIISNKLSAVSIRDFLLVTTVWKRSSFKVVARELGISPSGLSHQVRKVEEALGTTLFERSSQQVKTTLEGEVLLSHIQDVLSRVIRPSRSAVIASSGRSDRARRRRTCASVTPNDDAMLATVRLPFTRLR